MKSEPLEIKKDVPQDPALGPIFFVLLTNELSDFLHSVCLTVLCADDASLILCSRNGDQLDILSFNTFEHSNIVARMTLPLLKTKHNNLVLLHSETTLILSHKFPLLAQPNIFP